MDQVPIPVAPDLAIEVASPNDTAGDLMRIVRQYLAAGAGAVWLLYPDLGLARRYAGANLLQPEARSADAGGSFEEPALLLGLSLPLRELLPAL